MTRHSEPELVIPALQFIRDNPTGVTTTDIKKHLIATVHPSEYGGICFIPNNVIGKCQTPG